MTFVIFPFGLFLLIVWCLLQQIWSSNYFSMKSIRNILCPTDFSENARNAFEYTLWFADQCGAAIQLLHVVYPQAEPLDFSSIALKSIEKKESLARGLIKKFAAKSLEKMQSFYTFKAEPSIEILVKTGTPTNQISGIAKEIKADLIIMGTKSIHNAFQKIFGSITSATTNHAHCPVLVVPEETKSFKISQLVYTTNLRKIDLFQIWELGKQMRPFSP